jgi:hypothetical protein
MAITLVIEDGTGKPNANSYATVEEAKAYAESRGVTLGSDDSIAANLVLAADYMETTGPYKGFVYNDMQGLEFPRRERAGGPSLGIPEKIKKAQCQLLLDIKESGALLTSNRQFALKRRKLEGLEQEFAVGSYAAYKPKAAHPLYDHLMSGFSTYSGGGYLIR